MNSDLSWQICEPISTDEQYALFSSYQHVRHPSGEMSRMSFDDYQSLVEDTPVESSVYEFRNDQGTLEAVCLVDRIYHGLSAVYSFYNPELTRQSLGTYMVTWLIRRAKELGLDYVYLGFWIKACNKMAYKSSFRPAQIYHNGRWVDCDGDAPLGRE